MAANKKYYELDETQHIEDTDLFALGRGAEEDGTLSVTAKLLAEYVGSGPFDSNRAITRQIAGMEGLNINKANIKDFLDEFFFPAVAPLPAMTVDNPEREVGSSNAYTLSWSVVKKTNPITLIVVDGQNIAPSGANQSGTKSGTTATSSGTYTKNINVSDGTLTAGFSLDIKFLYKIFFGNSASVPSDSAAVRALSSSIFSNQKNFTLNTGSTNHIFSFALPDTVVLSKVIDLDALGVDLTSAYNMTTFSVQDAAGANKTYNVYTLNQAIPYSVNHRHAITLL